MAHEVFWREKRLTTRRYAAAVDVETDQPRAVSQKMTDGAILLIPVARHLLCCPSQNLHPKHIHRFEYDYEEGFIWKMDIDRCPPSPIPGMTCHVAQNRGEEEGAQARPPLYHSFLNLRFEVRELFTRGKTP